MWIMVQPLKANCDNWGQALLCGDWQDHGPLRKSHDPHCEIANTRTTNYCGFSACAAIEWTSSQYRDDWWKQLEEQLRSRRSQDPVIIMGDFNATLPDKSNQHIGDLTCGKANPNSIYLAQLMDKVEVWAPSTFTECHEGTSATWTHSSGQTSRLDYILVDDMLATHHCHSYPLPELDAGNPIEDHQAVGLSVAWTWTTKYRPVNKKRIDWHAISQRQNADKVRECLANIPNCAWGVDIHDHMQYVQDAIQYQLRQNFETNKKPRMRPYITDRTWQIRSDKLHIRAALRYVHREASKCCKAAKALRIWSNKEPATQQGAVWALIELFAAKQLRLTSRQLKAALKEDRDTHIAKLADDIGQAGSADIHQALSWKGLQSKGSGDVHPSRSWLGKMDKHKHKKTEPRSGSNVVLSLK